VLLLGLDTATPAVTAAVSDGMRVLAEETVVDARRQGELLAPSIQRVLAEAGVAARELTMIVAGAGPGPYTGLRVGLVTARALGSALGIPVSGICTLDVIAAEAPRGREFLVATDARRREVYWARYSAAGERVSGPAVAAPATLPPGLPVAGEGVHVYPDLPGEPLPPRYPSAGTLTRLAAQRLADGPPLPPPLPLYLRRPDARVPGPPKPTRPPSPAKTRAEVGSL
jgi:tRNA threonylcarbamoyl adenosine modification protein YeaZ